MFLIVAGGGRTDVCRGTNRGEAASRLARGCGPGGEPPPAVRRTRGALGGSARFRRRENDGGTPHGPRRKGHLHLPGRREGEEDRRLQVQEAQGVRAKAGTPPGVHPAFDPGNPGGVPPPGEGSGYGTQKRSRQFPERAGQPEQAARRQGVRRGDREPRIDHHPPAGHGRPTRAATTAGGGPDGGKGGNGGSVILEVSPNLFTLLDFRYRRIFKAKRGQHGMGKNMHGKNAPDLAIPVPPATMVIEHGTGELLADLTKEGDTLRVAEGGRGGGGEASLATSTNRAPDAA